ncbi:MAG: hypothetical protein DRN18_04145 [Thermoplasmata archaeon]|nr:MAG: hypothetical protein DRN18_04145 [Thermoplasmata archaeon]
MRRIILRCIPGKRALMITIVSMFFLIPISASLSLAQQSPIAIISAPDTALTNQTVTFDASQSHDPNGTILNYTWDFGDGTTGYGKVVNHSYTRPGNYTITLTILDNENLSNSTSKQIEVKSDSDGDGWSDEEESRYGTDPYNASSYPEDTDGDHLPDIEDDDDDNDGLNDTVEKLIETDPKIKNEFVNLSIDGKEIFLVDKDNDGVYDVFYDPTANLTTSTSLVDINKYLIDCDGDGKPDYTYNATSNTLNRIQRFTEIPWPIVIEVLVAIIIVVAIGYLYKKGRF